MQIKKTVSVDVTEDDVHKIIKDSLSLRGKQAVDLAKLLTYMVLDNTQGASNLFKIMYGEGLPDTLEYGTICKVHKDCLYNSEQHEQELLKNDLLDNEGYIYCKINSFLGWHGYSNYRVSYGLNAIYSDSIKAEDIKTNGNYEIESVKKITAKF
jgi:hypothetical protein